MSSEQDEIYSTWKRALQDFEIGRNYGKTDFLGGIPPAGLSLVNRVLASQLIVATVSLLDRCLEFARNEHKRPIRPGLKHDLYGRIETLKDLLVEPSVLHSLRKRRNDLAHKTGVYSDWVEASEAISNIESNLDSVGIDLPHPNYEFFATRSGPKVSDDPAVAFSIECEVGLQLDGSWVVKESWVEYIGRRNGG